MEPKVYNVSQDTSNIIYLLFKGETDDLTKESIREVYNDPKNYEVWPHEFEKYKSKKFFRMIFNLILTN